MEKYACLLKAELRLITVVYNGGCRRNPMPRPMPRRLCKVRSIKRISAINWIVSNGPHGKFMVTRKDQCLLIYYTIINLKVQ